MNFKTKQDLLAWTHKEGAASVGADLFVSIHTIARWLAGLNAPTPEKLRQIEARLAERAGGK